MNSSQILGTLVNDSNGINIFSQGDLAHPKTSHGFFTSIVSKAQELATKKEDEPIIRLETSTRTILISKIRQENGDTKTVAVSKSLVRNLESMATNPNTSNTTTSELYP
jgi:hypothetical protein